MKTFNLKKFNKYTDIKNEIPSLELLEKICISNNLNINNFFIEEKDFSFFDLLKDMSSKDSDKILELEERINIRNKYSDLHNKFIK